VYIILIGNMNSRQHLEDLGIDWKIILEWILGTQVGGCGLDAAGSDRDCWQALVNTVMNLQL